MAWKSQYANELPAAFAQFRDKEISKKLATTLSMATHPPQPLTPLSPPSLGQPTESQSPSPPMPRPLSTRRYLPRDEWPSTEQWAEPTEPHPTPSMRLRPLICRQQVPTRSTCMHLSMSPSTLCSLTKMYSPPKLRPLWPRPLGVWPSSLTTMYHTIHLHRHLWTNLLEYHYRTELPLSLSVYHTRFFICTCIKNTPFSLCSCIYTS